MSLASRLGSELSEAAAFVSSHWLQTLLWTLSFTVPFVLLVIWIARNVVSEFRAQQLARLEAQRRRREAVKEFAAEMRTRRAEKPEAEAGADAKDEKPAGDARQRRARRDV